jgi:hypothetical protein
MVGWAVHDGARVELGMMDDVRFFVGKKAGAGAAASGIFRRLFVLYDGYRRFNSSMNRGLSDRFEKKSAS